MRHVMVVNSKGGCGKSTLATNIASYFAGRGQQVALADYDPQCTSLDWLGLRPPDLPAITGVAASEGGLRGVPRDTDVVVIDAPRPHSWCGADRAGAAGGNHHRAGAALAHRHAGQRTLPG